jgi:ribonuclease J
MENVRQVKFHRPAKPAHLDAQSENIRIIPMGGVEEIGKNMTMIEYKDDIIIVDMGFQFSSEETPGIDYIIPDTAYLEQRKKKIRGVIITHGHLDHIGGIPYMMGKLGNPPIFTRLLTSLIIKKRQEEFPHLPKPKIEIVENDARVKIGRHLSVRFFHVTHTIPDAMGVIIETPFGNIVFTGDLKIDHTNGVPTEEEVRTFSALGKENNLVLLADSTNVERPGFSFSERQVHENLKKIIAEAQGRLIIGTFASLLERIVFVIKASEELGKKVVITGRSMKINVDIVHKLGQLNVQKHTIISPEDMANHPPSKIVVLATGAQGDEFAALMRMANKQHKQIKLQKGDTVLLSSSIIPGNEKSVQKLKDNLSRQGAKIIHYLIADVHSSGHANHDEMLWIHKQIRPRFFIPIHGHHYMLRVHGEIAKEAGIPDSNVIIPDNGMIIEIQDKGKKVATLKESASAGIVMIDALGKGNVKEVVIRDRQVLAQDGMFVVVAVLDINAGKVKQSPDIISRGFVYLKESQDLLRQTRFIVRKTIEDTVRQMHPINFDYVKNLVRERVSKFLFQQTGKRPIVIPVFLEV